MISTFGKRKNQTANARIMSKTSSQHKKQQYYFAITVLAKIAISPQTAFGGTVGLPQ
jgi:hypothetical protein